MRGDTRLELDFLGDVEAIFGVDVDSGGGGGGGGDDAAEEDCSSGSGADKTMAAADLRSKTDWALGRGLRRGRPPRGVICVIASPSTSTEMARERSTTGNGRRGEVESSGRRPLSAAGGGGGGNGDEDGETSRLDDGRGTGKGDDGGDGIGDMTPLRLAEFARTACGKTGGGGRGTDAGERGGDGIGEGITPLFLGELERTASGKIGGGGNALKSIGSATLPDF